ncbi:MAG: hypothetical protein V4611_00335 [Patescibacteria group bacterium]
MEEAIKSFEFWLSQFPESYHSLDDRRFYDFVEAIAATDEYVEEGWLIGKLKEREHRMRPEQVEDYDTRLKNIVAFLRDRRSL